MKKLLLVLFVLVAVVAMGYAANVTFTYPTLNSEVTWKQTASVTWTFTGHPGSSLVKLVLFKGGTDAAHKVGNIVQNITLGSGSCMWKGGEHEGGFASAGSDYYLRIVSMNGDFNYFSASFKIVLPKIPFEKLHREWVELIPEPGCPMCGVFNLEDLLARLGNPVDIRGDLVILRNGRQLGVLGKLGQGGMLLNRMSKLQFGAEDFGLLGQANQGFEVAIVGAGGSILKRQALSLKLR